MLLIVLSPFPLVCSAYRSRNCGMKIERGAVRVGVEADGDWGPYTRWHHAECFNFRSRQPSSLPGYNALCPEDRQSLASLCAGTSNDVTPRPISSEG